MSAGTRRNPGPPVYRTTAVMLVAGFAIISFAHAAESGAPDRPIYRCSVDGVPTFSDRPCGAVVVPHQIDRSRVSTYEPPERTPPARRTAPARPRTGTTKESHTEQRAKQLAECQRMDRELREIRSTMRSGYTIIEGERLKARARKLKQQRRELACT